MNQNVFITGVSSGIGWALAKTYLEQGARVFGLSRRPPPEIARHARFKFQALDLADSEAINPGIKGLLSSAEKLDLAVLNAGILGKVADLQETSFAEIQPVMNVNVWANKFIIDSLFALAIPIHQVVAISSGAATVAKRGWNAYSLSKAALNMLIALYAAECSDTHFCALAPGIIDTAMQDQISALPPDPRFDSLEMLRQAKGTPLMPAPERAAGRLIEGIRGAKNYPSGAFLDINALVRPEWKR